MNDIIINLLYLQEYTAQKKQNKTQDNYLSYGINRRTSDYSNNGNQPVVIHHPFSQLRKACSIM